MRQRSAVKGGRIARTKAPELAVETIRKEPKIIEEDGRKFRVEMLDGQEYKLLLDGNRGVSWASMTPDQIAKYAQAYCKEHSVTGIGQLQRGEKKNRGLAAILYVHNLVERIFPKETERIEILDGREFHLSLDPRGFISWQLMSDNQIVGYVVAYCHEHGITRIGQLEKGKKKNTALPFILRARNLVERVFPKETERVETMDEREFRLPLNNKGRISWKSMTDDQIVSYVSAYCKEHGITGIGQLQKGEKKNPGLVGILRKRNLVERVFQREIERVETLAGKEFHLPLDNKGDVSWASMSEDQIVDYAKAYCKEQGITKRSQLDKGEKKNPGLRTILHIRNLLDRVFPKSAQASDLSALADALGRFE